MSAGHTKLVKNGGEKETAKMMEGGGGRMNGGEMQEKLKRRTHTRAQ